MTSEDDIKGLVSLSSFVHGEKRYSAPPFLQQAFGQIFKDDGNGFSSIADFLLHETVPPQAFKVYKMITGRSCLTYIWEV